MSALSRLRSLRFSPRGSLAAGALALVPVLPGCANLATLTAVDEFTGYGATGALGLALYNSTTDDDPNFTGNVDEETLAWFLAAQYRMNVWIAFQLAYIQLGAFDYDGVVGAGLPRGVGTDEEGEVEASGVAASVLGFYPVENSPFQLYGRLGAFSWDADDEGTFGGSPYSLSEDGVDALFGLGVEAALSSHFAARLEWTRFVDVWDTDPDLLTFQIVYGF